MFHRALLVHAFILGTFVILVHGNVIVKRDVVALSLDQDGGVTIEDDGQTVKEGGGGGGDGGGGGGNVGDVGDDSGDDVGDAGGDDDGDDGGDDSGDDGGDDVGDDGGDDVVDDVGDDVGDDGGDDVGDDVGNDGGNDEQTDTDVSVADDVTDNSVPDDATTVGPVTTVTINNGDNVAGISGGDGIAAAVSVDATSATDDDDDDDNDDNDDDEDGDGSDASDAAVPLTSSDDTVVINKGHGGEKIGEKEEDIMGDARRRRRSAKREMLLSKDHHPMEVTLVMLDGAIHHRVKRTSFNTSVSTWPHHIPYVFESDFKTEYSHQLHEVLNFLQNHLCVRFTNEQNFDKSNPNWFKEHGYDTNAYINFRSKDTCVAVYGRGASDSGERDISPCTQFFVMMHEVIHSLGGIHAQNYPYRERYIVVHDDNINPANANNFVKYEPDSTEVEYENFDPSSLLMYPQGYFSLNGLSTYDYIRPEMNKLNGPSTYRNIILEINKNYKCQESFCKNEDPDCGIGYLGYVDQHCECVCPRGFDPASKCKQLLNNVGSTYTWPKTPFTLYKAEECPSGMETGTVPITVSAQPRIQNKVLSVSGKTLNLEMCTKPEPTQDADYDSWPIGSYCIGKVNDVPCGDPFVEGEIQLTTSGTMSLSGSVGDVSVSGNKVSLKYCCRREGDYRFPMRLPTDKAFRLVANYRTCQEVEGMWVIPSPIFLKTKGTKSGGGPLTGKSRRYGFKHTSCYYQPPTYDCNENVELDTNNPSVKVSVPLKDGNRESNRRCFLYFHAPDNSRLRLTINKLSLHPSDRVYVKRFNLLENPSKIDIADPPYQLTTERNTLMIEYWSYYKGHYSLKGADFKVDLLAPEDLCFDKATNGADYAGNKEISETYEPCLPWGEAAGCPDFPWMGTNGVNLLNSGSSCRNLDDKGLFQPWCYTYVNGTMCNKRYCDVCDEAEPVDKVSGCHKYTQDSEFCKSALGRFGCFKSCGMDTAPYTKDSVHCGMPDIPDSITILDGLQESYNVGDVVPLSCNGQDTEIKCSPHGWTPLDEVCTADACLDASQQCQNALSKFPEFCTHKNSMATAETYCKKSCGLCEPGSCGAGNGGTYSQVTPSGDLTTGQDATFACSADLNYVTGDLTRACSLTGELLGEEPVCEAAKSPVDINLGQIYYKTKFLRPATAALMLGYGLDVPFDGKITRWFYYCRKSGSITFLVYRKTANSNVFTRVGYNTAECVAGWPWSTNVVSGKQIAVKKGDILGVHDVKMMIAVQNCGRSKLKWVPIKTVTAQSLSELEVIDDNDSDTSDLDVIDDYDSDTIVRRQRALLRRKRMTFKKEICAYLAFGARVEPN